MSTNFAEEPNTHTFLWWNLNAPVLSEAARAFIGDGGNEIFFSAASVWEIAFKYGKGRPDLPQTPQQHVADRLAQHRFTPLPIQLSHALQVHALPDIHQDPFDRLLISQGQIEGVPLLSGNVDIARYDVYLIW